MSDRRDRKSRVSSSRSRSRSRSNHKKKSQKQKHKKNSRKYNRSYSRSSSRSRSRTPPKRSPNNSNSPSPKKDYNARYAKKVLEQYQPEKQQASVPAVITTPGYQPAQEESSCLIITGLNDDTSQDQLEDLLRDVAISLQTSPPDSIQVVSVLKTAYAVFPSVDAAKKILLTLRGKLDNGNVNLALEFYPTNLSNQRSSAASKDVSLVQDWICDKCEYKNFAKRMKCHKCENPRNTNCKVVYNSPCYIKQAVTPQSSGIYYTPNLQETSGSNNSVMVRGAVLQDISETTLLDFFNQYAPVKDIRMVRNKTTGKWRDFAFIEFFTVEEAEKVLKASQDFEFRIDGQPVTVAFSRTKRREDDYNYGTEETSPHLSYQQNRQYYGSYNNTSDVSYSNVGTDSNSAYYAQNYYNQQQLNQYQQQYMQNYGQTYNYNQAGYSQGQAYSGYGNYGYDLSQNYARQAYTQQLQQQLQPSIIQQTIQQQQYQQQQQTKQQTQQQSQAIMPNLASSSISTPLYTSLPQQTEKKNEEKVQAPKPAEAQIPNNNDKETHPPNEKMQVEEKKIEKSEETISKKENPTKDENEDRKMETSVEPQKDSNEAQTQDKSKTITTSSNVRESSKKSKVDDEKAKRKQIEMEMKKWEREQVQLFFIVCKTCKQMRAMMGPGQEEQETQQQHSQQQTQQQKKGESKQGTTQEGEKLAPMQVQSKQKSTIFTNSEIVGSVNNNEQPKTTSKKEVISYKVYLGDLPVCKLCKRKFNDEYSINLHEKFSKMHKDNIEKLAHA